MLKRMLMVAALMGAGLAAAAEEVSDMAIQLFGKEESGKRVETGALFIDGLYIKGPYEVTRQGNVIFINGRVAIWEGQDLDVCHRHHSHLSMIYPFDLTAELTSEESEEVDQAVEHWIWRGAGQWSEWCYPWAMILQSRWGMREAPSVLLEVWKRLFLNESLATVYLPKFRGISSHRRADALKPKETNEVMQLDGTMAAATALLELTIHERGGVIELFPGIPEIWPDVEFVGVHLPGGLVASGVRRNGSLRSFRLQSIAERRVRLPRRHSSCFCRGRPIRRRARCPLPDTVPPEIGIPKSAELLCCNRDDVPSMLCVLHVPGTA